MNNLPSPLSDPTERVSWANQFSYAAGCLVRQVLGESCFPYAEVPLLTRRDCVEAFRRGVEGCATSHPAEIVQGKWFGGGDRVIFVECFLYTTAG